MAGQGRGLGRLVNALRTSAEFWQHLCGRGGWGRAREREKDGGVARCICNRSFIIIEGEYAITAPNLNLYIEDLPVSLSRSLSQASSCCSAFSFIYFVSPSSSPSLFTLLFCFIFLLLLFSCSFILNLFFFVLFSSSSPHVPLPSLLHLLFQLFLLLFTFPSTSSLSTSSSTVSAAFINSCNFFSLSLSAPFIFFFLLRAS